MLSSHTIYLDVQVISRRTMTHTERPCTSQGLAGVLTLNQYWAFKQRDMFIVPSTYDNIHRPARAPLKFKLLPTKAEGGGREGRGRT